MYISWEFLTINYLKKNSLQANTFDDGNKVEKEKKTSLLKMIKDTFSSNDGEIHILIFFFFTLPFTKKKIKLQQ